MKKVKKQGKPGRPRISSIKFKPAENTDQFLRSKAFIFEI